MKARICQVFHVGEYTEMRLSEFIQEFPQLVPVVSQMSGIDVVQAVKYDDGYIIRFNEYGAEIGYYSDVWHMFK